MNLQSQFRNTILNARAACDLGIEELVRQRSSLDCLLELDEPQQTQPHPPSAPDRHRRSHIKGPPSTLHIIIDGEIISEPQAANGFVKAIALVGPGRVEVLASRLGGNAVVVRGAKPAKGNYHRSGEFCIATHSDTAGKRNVLREICGRLGLSYSIRRVLRNQSRGSMSQPSQARDKSRHTVQDALAK